MKRMERCVSAVKYPRVILEAFGDGLRAVTLANPKRDNLLVHGFVNQTFKQPAFKGMQLLPLYLIQMMVKWLCTEHVHFFVREIKHSPFENQC